MLKVVLFARVSVTTASPKRGEQRGLKSSESSSRFDLVEGDSKTLANYFAIFYAGDDTADHIGPRVSKSFDLVEVGLVTRCGCGHVDWVSIRICQSVAVRSELLCYRECCQDEDQSALHNYDCNKFIRE